MIEFELIMQILCKNMWMECANLFAFQKKVHFFMKKNRNFFCFLKKSY